MSLIIAFGSNIGCREDNLRKALKLLENTFQIIKISHIYESQAIDCDPQGNFLNLVAEYKTPTLGPCEVLQILLDTEKDLGRVRTMPKGPRLIDLDLLIYDDIEINRPNFVLPHPRMYERSFVVRPLSELPSFKELSKKYKFQTSFKIEASLWGEV